jgi:4-diphosphocytidyl-2-C-methyl-D-erythritol kinase
MSAAGASERMAPAKVNLSLRVKGRRVDGFHDIETLMVPVSVFDRLFLSLKETAGISFFCDDSSLPNDETNLAVRAARLFFEETGLEPGLEMRLLKGVPHGAGLGGGSSDAASVLLGLNRMLGAEVSLGRLSEMASRLGSDVPFFVYECAALCSGRGEVVEPVVFPVCLPLLLVKPPFGVPTPWAYQRWSQSRELPGVLYAAQEFDWGVLVNDLERPVFEKYLFLAELKMWFLEQPEVAGALMSGSGATVFAVLHRKEEGASVLKRLEGAFGPHLWGRVCETLVL